MIPHPKLWMLYWASLLLPYAPGLLQAQNAEEWYTLEEEIVVTASRIPTNFADVARTVVILDQEQIKRLPAGSIAELLSYALGVHIQQRGTQGVQADVSIRGSTFEQVLILIDGQKVSDPQTGHHNLNLPINLVDVYKIEILKGSGSSLYGANAFGGVINIITKPASLKNNQINLQASAGEYGLYEGAINLRLPNKLGNHQFSLAQKNAAGYRPNTEFSISRASYAWDHRLVGHQITFFGGWLDKAFGANGFYHPDFPNQWEQIRTAYINTGLSFKDSSFSYSGHFSWRYNQDQFQLDRTRPDFYFNKHYSHVLIINLHTQWINPFGISSLGAEWKGDRITSNNLGDHNRPSISLFLEHQVIHRPWHLILGWSGYHYLKWGWRMWPGLDLSYKILENFNAYFSIGHAFRIPTYTELYYRDAANRGNSSLKPESAWNYEMGLRIDVRDIHGQMAVFRRAASELIDWFWIPSENIWQAGNITKINTTGIELNLQYRNLFLTKQAGLEHIHFGYTYLKSGKDARELVSKYVINHLRHQLSLGWGQSLFIKGLFYNLHLRYEDHLQFTPRWLIDGRLHWQSGTWDVFIDGTNLLNKTYHDHFSLPLPRRWIKFGFQYRFEWGRTHTF